MSWSCSPPHPPSPLSPSVPLQVLVDGPNEKRRVLNLKRLALTDLKCDIVRGAKKTALLKAWKDAKGTFVGCGGGW